MTITNETTKVVYQGDDAATTWPFTFLIPEGEAVVSLVTIETGETEELDPAAFTITGEDDPDGGDVEYPLSGSPLSTDYYIVVQRITPYTQTTDLSNQSGYYPETVENMADKIVYQTQQLNEEMSRTVRFPVSDDEQGTLPTAVARANKIFGFDDDGQPVAVELTDGQVAVSAPWATVIGAASIAAGLLLMGVQQSGWCGTSAGAANAQTGTSDQTISLAAGLRVAFIAGFSNTNTTTFNLNAGGAVNIFKQTAAGPVALAGGEIIAGNITVLQYDGTRWQLLSGGSSSATGAFALSGTITPSILNAQQDDYNPTGLDGAVVVRLTSSTGVDITGLAGGTAGRFIALQNLNATASQIRLRSGNASSAAANRFGFQRDVYIRPGGTMLLQYDAVASLWRQTQTLSELPPGTLFGMVLANNVADATNDIDITAGSARDSSNVFDILGSALTKRLDADWAAGTNQGMRYAGAAITNTCYHIFSIAKLDGTADYFAYTGIDPTSVLPAGYLFYRRLGSILRVGGVILPFTQVGDTFWLTTSVRDVNVVNLSTARTLYPLTVPLGVQVMPLFRHYMGTGSTASVVIQSPLETDAAPSLSNIPLVNASIPTADAIWMNTTPVISDTSGQIAARSTTASTTLIVVTYGWRDFLGRFA